MFRVMLFRPLFRALSRARLALVRKKKPRSSRPPDPRVDASPWLAQLLDALGDRYRLAEGERADGIQVLRRTGKERFNPMRVYLRPGDCRVTGEYDVRVHEGTFDDARALLDRRVGARLQTLGLRPAGETSEEWGGRVVTRKYAGTCDVPSAAADAVRFMCEQSDQVIDSRLE